MRARNLPAMIARRPRLELESMARSQTERAIRTPTEIMKDESAPPMARITAAKVLLERGWGRPAQVDASDGGGKQEPLIKIVREVVHVTKTAEEIAAEDVPH